MSLFAILVSRICFLIVGPFHEILHGVNELLEQVPDTWGEIQAMMLKDGIHADAKEEYNRQIQKALGEDGAETMIGLLRLAAKVHAEEMAKMHPEDNIHARAPDKDDFVLDCLFHTMLSIPGDGLRMYVSAPQAIMGILRNAVEVVLATETVPEVEEPPVITWSESEGEDEKKNI